MHILITGCGRLAATLAQSLEDQDHAVAIARDPATFRRLGSHVNGRHITGVGLDQETLRAIPDRTSESWELAR